MDNSLYRFLKGYEQKIKDQFSYVEVILYEDIYKEITNEQLREIFIRIHASLRCNG